ncbi:AraC family transcriptional regulator [Myceligenerans pegani]|uniref:AraC family transcriptional regulator n=1 Tax=Myceligenerans pegani TaxID=2776917 RepID=A0ABR9N337_9MICO|nr:AraC family transcriptional regulator [Myceligenerans sp. TRM 65318]MBE1878073.1 AraC family transcriptional regulator [Myceligenerans sp. TRM 65318]MBE3020344.1 AraC family transcriptional regulator [Myceligenerans sp. TRM 65318]
MVDTDAPLGDGLHLLRFTGALYCQADLTAPWGVEFPRIESCVMLPVVLSGRCVLEIGRERHLLEAGSAALIMHATPHRLLSSPGAPGTGLFDIPVERVGETYERMRFGGGGERTQIAYAAMTVDEPLTARLVQELPDVIRVDPWDDGEPGAFGTVLRLLAHEAQTLAPGGEAVMTRLADVLVIQVLRRWLRDSREASTGWLAALRDPHVGRVLGHLHAQPELAWSLVEMAQLAGMSRSAFAERFTGLLGEPPMRYLARWRLEQAYVALTTTTDPVAAISRQVGYGSEAAFGRAFKRHHGMSPGAARRSGTARSVGSLRTAADTAPARPLPGGARPAVAS